MRWKKTKAPLSGAVGYRTEDGLYHLGRVWGSKPMTPRWRLSRVSERALPRRWVDPWEHYDEDLGEIVEQPGFWAGGWVVQDNLRLTDWPDSPSGPTRRASGCIMNNKNEEVTQ